MRIHEIKIVPSLLLAVSLLFSAICLASCGETNESADTPIDSMPLFVRAGSVIPTAPDMQYTEQIKQAPYTITVYPGADGRFTLYEDEGDGYDYESGAYAETDLVWNDAARTLTISDRCGSFDGMTTVRKMSIRVVGGGHVDTVFDGHKQVIPIEKKNVYRKGRKTICIRMKEKTSSAALRIGGGVTIRACR